MKVEYGNGTVTDYTYDPLTLRLTRLKTTDAQAQVIQDLSYTYDSVGNILEITDAKHFDSQSFEYDELNRLVAATGDNYGTKTYSYDEIGNITSKEGVSYTYGQNGAGPHAVTSLSDGTTYAYDANGNMTSRTKLGVVRTFEYDVENRLMKVREGGNIIEEYEYDGDGGRTKKTTYPVEGGVVQTKFVGSLFETTGTRETFHVFLGDKRIASATNGEVVFIHENHLGSANLITDVDGLIKELIEYEPYGKFARHEKYGSSEDIAWHYFTGQRLDDRTGLYFYNARYYDPGLGRFISADTIVQALGNPQTFNRYTYANNNPSSNIDPSGHGWFRKVVGHVVAAIAAAAVFFGTGGNVGVAANTYNSVESIVTPAANGNWGQAAQNTLNVLAMGSGNPYYMISGALGMISYRTSQRGYNDLSRTLGYVSQGFAALGTVKDIHGFFKKKPPAKSNEKAWVGVDEELEGWMKNDLGNGKYDEILSANIDYVTNPTFQDFKNALAVDYDSVYIVGHGSYDGIKFADGWHQLSELSSVASRINAKNLVPISCFPDHQSLIWNLTVRSTPQLSKVNFIQPSVLYDAPVYGRQNRLTWADRAGPFLYEDVTAKYGKK